MKRIVTLGILCVMAVSILALAASANNGNIVFRVVLLDTFGAPQGQGQHLRLQLISEKGHDLFGIGKDGKATVSVDQDFCDNKDVDVIGTIDEDDRCEYHIDKRSVCGEEAHPFGGPPGESIELPCEDFR